MTRRKFTSKFKIKVILSMNLPTIGWLKIKPLIIVTYENTKRTLAKKRSQKAPLETNLFVVNLVQKMTQQTVSIYNNLRTPFRPDARKPAEVHLNPNIKYKSYRKNNVSLPEGTIS